jgi:hypothetical protein
LVQSCAGGIQALEAVRVVKVIHQVLLDDLLCGRDLCGWRRRLSGLGPALFRSGIAWRAGCSLAVMDGSLEQPNTNRQPMTTLRTSPAKCFTARLVSLEE